MNVSFKNYKFPIFNINDITIYLEKIAEHVNVNVSVNG